MTGYPAWPELFRWLTVLKDRVEQLPSISAEQVITGTLDPSVIPPIPWDLVLKAGSSLGDLETRSAGDLSSGTLLDARMPALTGDVSSVAGTVATTLATVNLSPGSYGSGTLVPIVTVNEKGLVTDVMTQPIVLVPGGYIVGDLLYANSLTTLAELHDVAAGSYLRSGGVATAPLWSTLKLPNAVTAGSVVFASATNTYGQDNANLFWDDSNNRLGIGTATPNEQLELTGNLRVPVTTSAVGRIMMGANRWIDALGTGNLMIGVAGFPAGNTTLSGSYNIGIGGDSTLTALTSGSNNIAIGRTTGGVITTGSSNFLLGSLAGNHLTTGSNNTAVGTNALGSANTVSELVAVGANALTQNTTGTQNTAVGFNAGLFITTGDFNTAIGYIALQGISGAPLTGSQNTAIGRNAMSALQGAAAQNTGVGLNALSSTTIGSKNVAIGQTAGTTNVTGDSNTFLGATADVVSGALSKAIAIGFGAIAGASNVCAIGGTSTNAVFVGINMTAPTARLHLPAGTATASTAPLKFNSGTSLTTAEAGAIEFTTDDYFATITTGAARKAFVLDDGARLTSGRIPVATTNGRLVDSALRIPVTGRSTAQTAAVATVVTTTLAASDGSMLVSANVNVTVSTLHSFSVQVDYTDETNTAQTLTLSFSQLSAAIVSVITNATGAGPYEGLVAQIRCKASTAITVKTTGTFTTVTYNVEATLSQIS